MSHDPYRRHPTYLTSWPSQRCRNRVLDAIRRRLTGKSVLGKVLGSNILFKALPVGDLVAHLGKEDRFEPTGFMTWVERILPQLAWIDTGFFCTRDSAQHGASISFGHYHSKQAAYVGFLQLAGVDPALFNPLRNRIQGWIDRRFYRKKYDAQQVLARFAITARDETDMNALTAELAQVVQETLEPEQVNVWLRKPERPTRSDTVSWYT